MSRSMKYNGDTNDADPPYHMILHDLHFSNGVPQSGLKEF